jgi:hypothetical protein
MWPPQAVKKEVKDLGEEDIEAILAELRAKEAEKTAVTVNDCQQPSPRANFSLTSLSRCALSWEAWQRPWQSPLPSNKEFQWTFSLE